MQKAPKKIITLAHQTAEMQCDNCKSSCNHYLTIQAVQTENWSLNLVAVCWRCKTSTHIKFEESVK